jgi:hypothetical protein
LRPRHPRTDVSGECESEQARAKQNETGNRHGKETVGSEFIAHHGPPPNRSGTLITDSAPLLEQNDCHFAQSKGFCVGPKNQILTDALEQQGRATPSETTIDAPLRVMIESF